MLIAGRGEVGIQVMAEICERVLDGFGMLVKWVLCIAVLVFNGMVISGIAAATVTTNFLCME